MCSSLLVNLGGSDTCKSWYSHLDSIKFWQSCPSRFKSYASSTAKPRGFSNRRKKILAGSYVSLISPPGVLMSPLISYKTMPHKSGSLLCISAFLWLPVQQDNRAHQLCGAIRSFRVIQSADEMCAATR